MQLLQLFDKSRRFNGENKHLRHFCSIPSVTFDGMGISTGSTACFKRQNFLKFKNKISPPRKYAEADNADVFRGFCRIIHF